ncbi:glycosyltransferase family 4 protein [Formosa algae]|uniref:Glycosyltransferase involved in cell wall biosynthesis n=1 Tax=Formosa algae TaxID=225843 RepID=A0A9X0YMX1_9FLAO|nr:glycosyltransferase family 4 protein [Formosa algae]MBP1841702.1 glycosyltransferase involved in cell wall biosynthesis [Formosa algae]MDQ0337180.1 glycosyltransferase involved in cell wall biosynthesis [Formosa algae]OEI79870.1 group 1 glycosyl transferase [Formosa algae]
MRIHFIISRLKGGGAERVLTLLATAFAKKTEYDISIITLNDCEDFYTIPDSIERISMDYGRITNHTVKSIVNLSSFYSKKANRPDLIISFITLTNFITIIVAKLFGIKIIVEEHNSYLRAMQSRKQLTEFTRKHLYKRADLLTVLTSFDVSYYEQYNVNVMVMPNPCSFLPLTSQITAREKTILAVGNLDRYNHKGFDNLIEFIAPILKSNPEWTLKIAGTGDQGLTLLTKLVEQYHIADQVVFTGFVSNISELMQTSSIFVLSSRFEGLPMVLLEAMSQGMASIAYNCKTGPSDIITNNVNGLLIEDQNIEEMQTHLQRLIDNPSLRQSLAEEAIKSLETYHIDTIIEKYEHEFKKLQIKG